jgi:ribonuclease P protein component
MHGPSDGARDGTGWRRSAQRGRGRRPGETLTTQRTPQQAVVHNRARISQWAGIGAACREPSGRRAVRGCPVLRRPGAAPGGLTATVCRPYRCPVAPTTAAAACPVCASSVPTSRSTRRQVQEPTSEQAHVPAEQPPAGQDPRLPPAHAHTCWPRDHRRSALQGAHAALGLTDVLPAGSRLRRRADFVATLRSARGARGAGLLVVHVSTGSGSSAGDDMADAAPSSTGSAPRVGFVVSRAVGPAVTRNRVRRRLRHLVAARLDRLPSGSRVVVRALPASATASHAQLAAALERALERAVSA